MQKRLLIAFVISWVILVFYHQFFPQKADKLSPPHSEYPQIIENKYDTEKSSTSPQGQDTAFLDVETKESIEILENDKLNVEISNIFGEIQSLNLNEHQYKYPLEKILRVNNQEKSLFSITHKSKNEISYQQDIQNFTIRKNYKLIDSVIWGEISVFNKSSSVSNYSLTTTIFSINNLLIDKSTRDSTDISLLEYAYSQNGQIIRKGNAAQFNQKEKKTVSGNFDWFAFRSRYFCFVVKPLFESAQFMINPENKDLLSFELAQNEISLAPSQSITLKFKIYAGSQDVNILKEFDPKTEHLISFSGFSLFDLFAKLSVKILNFLYQIFRNWGLSIIVIAFLIYAITYPLTLKGMLSMKKMQLVQPKINKIKEQYQGNPQRLNQEIMKLYKENRINPFGGCLPFILQMPVFVGLYQALWRSVVFKGERFLWIKDLSQPDRLFILPVNLPFLGNEFNILPIFVGIAMFFQQKISAKNAIILDETQQAQQKIMLVFFPIFLAVIFYKFSSGVTLYFTIFYLLSTLSQWKMLKVKLV